MLTCRRFEGRRALVTGAGSGIGRATALRLAAEGAKVAVTDARGDAARAVAETITSAGGTAVAAQMDVTNEETVSDATNATAETLGGLDVIAACAGIAHPGATHEMPLEAWERMIGINLTGVFMTIKHGVPHLLAAGGGSIVTIGSVASLVAAGQAAAYDASKGGVLQLTRAVAVEYVDRGIRANCVCPGMIATGLGQNSRLLAPHAETSGRIRPAASRVQVPISGHADPDVIASAVAYLASDDAAFVTGVALPVDGGYTAI